MTIELEEQFFKVFGIEPIPIKSYGYWLIKGSVTENDKGEKVVYPEITDRRLLEIEDILLKKHIQIEYCFYNGNYYSSCSIALCNGKSDNKKDAFLGMLISIAQNYLDNCDTDGEEEIYKQIQQLFKREE